ncbi:hypothetical protein [Lysobacter sp. CA196]|uniref:hypothetical protein n=1 Tax=Lysobacter sp. CA196 TaxID=3455606 RepID=UPI003F8D6F0F
MTKTLRVLSLGAGVQSTAIALMMARGQIEPPEVAVFADTQVEPASVYRHLDWLKRQLPFPVTTVSAGNLGDEILATSRGERINNARPPFFVRNPDGSRGMLRRQCTGDYKIDPIRRHVRTLLGVGPGSRVPSDHQVEMIMGISLDEAGRMKIARDRWQTNVYPLVERRLTRWDCLQWMRRHGFPEPPKSACYPCPFRSDREWRRLRDDDPADFARAVAIDHAIRTPGYGRLVGESYVHASLIPLDAVDFSTPADKGKLNLWEDECDGQCGV